jgi:hypothetical protein
MVAAIGLSSLQDKNEHANTNRNRTEYRMVLRIAVAIKIIKTDLGCRSFYYCLKLLYSCEMKLVGLATMAKAIR